MKNNDTFIISEAKCRKPDDLSNGAVNCPNTSYVYQSICSYQCNTGFTLQGSVFTQCQADKTWTVVDAPECVGNNKYINRIFIQR